MNLEELVNDKYDFLTANDREMLTTIFRDKQAVKEMNSTQLASFLQEIVRKAHSFRCGMDSTKNMK